MNNIVCYGEVLWDMLPEGKYAGGAPFNIAYHLCNLGIDVHLISKVGDDDLGKELLQKVKEKNINTEYIQKGKKHLTGLVKATLNRKGEPTYRVLEPVAYDYIFLNDDLLSLVKNSNYLVYSSLSARNRYSKNTLLELIKLADKKVFTVNLRPPNYDLETIKILLQEATICKMNNDELNLISNWDSDEQDRFGQMQGLVEKYNIKTLIVTLGSKGTVVLSNGEFYIKPPMPQATIKSTIGSADGFLAYYLYNRFHELSIEQSIDAAYEAALEIAKYDSATPDLDFQTFQV